MLTLVVITISAYGSTHVAAFSAAVRGGRLFADGMFNALIEQAAKGVVLCPGIIDKDFDPNSEHRATAHRVPTRTYMGPMPWSDSAEHRTHLPVRC